MPKPSRATPPTIWMAVRYCRMAPEMAFTPSAAPSAINPSPAMMPMPGCHAAEETALDRALDAEQIDRPEGHRQQHAHDDADWYDEGVGDVRHGGTRIVTSARAEV